jgi:hypothetical protein
VLFRTAEGSVLTKSSLTEVAFEIDHVDGPTRTGWSVLVKGRVDDIGDAIDQTSDKRLRRLALVTWASGRRDRWYVVRPAKSAAAGCASYPWSSDSTEAGLGGTGSRKESRTQSDLALRLS